MGIIHNSALADYRDPPGAAPAGGKIRIRIHTGEDVVQGARLRVFINGIESQYDMEPDNGFFRYSFPLPALPCVVWYSFILSFSDKILYYGPQAGHTQGEGQLYSNPCPSYQLTVYDPSFQTPSWFQGGIMYQIFPDRFCRGAPENLHKGAAYHQSMGRRAVLHENWEEPLLYTPLPDMEYYSPCDFYGGDLQGIRQSLKELQALGVKTIYLNPIVEAASNHRYDTADYTRVDPFLGTNKDFSELCKEAGQIGMGIMIDGVYSHTGSDSRYFNKPDTYAEPGAYQSPQSPYYHWYSFSDNPPGYRCWWGFRCV